MLLSTLFLHPFNVLSVSPDAKSDLCKRSQMEVFQKALASFLHDKLNFHLENQTLPLVAFG